MIRRLLLFLLLAGAAFAQTRPYVAGSLGASTMGYDNPLLEGSVGVESYVPHALLLGDLSGGLSRKIETGNGENLRLSGATLFRYKHLIAGPGLTYGKQWTSAWEKSRYQFQAFAGVDYDRIRFVTGWQGGGNDTRNGNRSLLFSNEFKFGKHWRWSMNGSVSWFHETDCPRAKMTGGTFYEGVKYVF